MSKDRTSFSQIHGTVSWVARTSEMSHTIQRNFLFTLQNGTTIHPLACSRDRKTIFHRGRSLLVCRPHRHSSRCSKFPRQKPPPVNFRPGQLVGSDLC